MTRKKILWLTSWYPNRNDRFDGDFIQRHARAAAINHDIHVLFITEADMEKKIEEEWWQASGLTEQIIYFKKQAGALAGIKKQFTRYQLFLKAVDRYFLKNGKPYCIHVHIPWKAGLMALWLKRKHKIPFIVSEHWNIYNNTVNDNIYSRSFLFRGLLKTIYKHAHSVVTVSAFLGKGITEFAGNKPYMVIPNVVDTSLFFFQEERHSRFSFIHVSNMTSLKNVNIILEAFCEFQQAENNPPVQLIMVGNRDHHFMEMARRMGILNRSVFFKGEVPYAEVAEEVRRSHCFVLFSSTETFSCVTAEALCCGLPVIASKVGALPELVNETNGVLVTSKSTLTEAMRKIWKTPPPATPILIAKEASAKYNYTSVGAQFSLLYQNLFAKADE